MTVHQTEPIAALYVLTNGHYFNLNDVDPWDANRDARQYRGPYPVVAHPPCQRWGAHWNGGPDHANKELGDDAGCFEWALWAVRTFGGVLEHPKNSHAWSHFGLNKPSINGGWIEADEFGYTCCVEQGHYGHRARKATWLYAVNTDLQELKWGPSVNPTDFKMPAVFAKPVKGMRVEDRAYRRVLLEQYSKATGKVWVCAEMMNKRERASTPIEFRDLLLSMARSVYG